MAAGRLAGALFLLLGAGSARAQQPFQFWYTYNHTGLLTDRWGYTFDVNHRTRDIFPAEAALTAVRVGGIYNLTPRLRLTAGYAWFGTFVPEIDRIWMHEHRLYQQAQWTFRPSGLTLSHRVRTEQRWRELLVDPSVPADPVTRTIFNFRARYMLQVSGPLTRQDSTGAAFLRWQAANEILFQTGFDELFDQNRTLAGVTWRISGSLELATLYQFIVQWRPEFNVSQNIHSVRLTLFHTLDLRPGR